MSEMVEDRLDVAVNHLSSYIEKVERNIHEEDNNLQAEIDRLREYADGELNKLYGYVDSRTDKMATNVSKHIAEINQVIDALK